MKARAARVTGELPIPARGKADALVNGAANSQQTSAQAIRKRRSSINVYDQPSSLNSRLRQLETDMLRLDEDRSKLYDDTHSSLAQYDLRINEIQAILRSRQDNVEKYIEDMRLLIQAKEDFEKQAKSLNEKHDRIQDKFMHRETTISREIKLLKNKFELLEKDRHIKSILHKSSGGNNLGSKENADDSSSGHGSSDLKYLKKESNCESTGELDTDLASQTDEAKRRMRGDSLAQKSVTGKRGFLEKIPIIGRLFSPLAKLTRLGTKTTKKLKPVRRKSNRVGSLGTTMESLAADQEAQQQELGQVDVESQQNHEQQASNLPEAPLNVS